MLFAVNMRFTKVSRVRASYRGLPSMESRESSSCVGAHQRVTPEKSAVLTTVAWLIDRTPDLWPTQGPFHSYKA